jgi:hypothetical protein
MAGRSVTDAIITTRTVTEAPVANPWTNFSPIRNNPSSEMTTVMPAKITARPDVTSAVTTASSGSMPAWSVCRYRVTMNSA